MIRLKDLLAGIKYTEFIGSDELVIDNIQFDSRLVKANSLFIAIKGTNSDGHEYINKAINAGAVAIVAEKRISNISEGISVVYVKNSSHALGIIAANFYNNPTQKLKIVGVTGTNGKTTIATLLYRLFSELGYRCGLISTVVNKIGEKEFPSTHTTPDAIQLQHLFSQMVMEGCEYAFMEVSSHAVVQQRIVGIKFTGGIFTNLTHDHLDFHKTFEAYRDAKKMFFDNLPKSAFALTNIDDKNGNYLLQNTSAVRKTYSLKSLADFKCKVIESQFSGLQLNIDGTDVWCKLVGEFNAYNLLAIYGAAILLGKEKFEVLKHLSNLNPVEGRFEYVRSKNNITAIIDYAHTPDALSNVINTINSIGTGNEKLITVVGCGGDRDAKKRPVMGKIAASLSYKAIFTSDNPRSEDPEEIINQMQSDLTADERKKVISIVNRKEAIKTACALAVSGDIILIAGKGHEKYQEIKGIKHPFDDKEVVQTILQNI